MNTKTYLLPSLGLMLTISTTPITTNAAVESKIPLTKKLVFLAEVAYKKEAKTAYDRIRDAEIKRAHENSARREAIRALTTEVAVAVQAAATTPVSELKISADDAEATAEEAAARALISRAELLNVKVDDAATEAAVIAKKAEQLEEEAEKLEILADRRENTYEAAPEAYTGAGQKRKVAEQKRREAAIAYQKIIRQRGEVVAAFQEAFEAKNDNPKRSRIVFLSRPLQY